MLLTITVVICLAIFLTGVIFGTGIIRRRQTALRNRGEAAKLQRRADHLFIVALASQMHTRKPAIAKVLLEETLRVLDHSSKLTAENLRLNSLWNECHELLSSIDLNPSNSPEPNGQRQLLEFPDSELLEAQLHLREATRLLVGFEKRGLISADELTAMAAELRQSQRAIELQLQLHQAAQNIASEQQDNEANRARIGEYLAATGDNKSQPWH